MTATTQKRRRAITQKATDLCTNNYAVIGLLMAEFLVHQQTITRWIKDGHANLRLPAAVKIIREQTGLRDEEILERESEQVEPQK